MEFLDIKKSELPEYLSNTGDLTDKDRLPFLLENLDNLEDLPTSDTIHVSKIFQKVMERFGINSDYVSFFRYIPNTNDNSPQSGIIYYGTRYEAKDKNYSCRNLIFGIPQFHITSEKDLNITLEGYFALTLSSVKLRLDSLPESPSYTEYERHLKAVELGKQFGYENSISSYLSYSSSGLFRKIKIE